MDKLIPMEVKVWLVMVTVRYTKGGFDSAFRFWPVRIVARNADSAQIGAMNWAEMQHPEGIPEDAGRFAYEATTTIALLGGIDCIAESLKIFTEDRPQSANAEESQPAEEHREERQRKNVNRVGDGE